MLLLGALPFFVGILFDIWDWKDWGHIHENLRSTFSTHDLPTSG
jgi:hypothetical protein